VAPEAVPLPAGFLYKQTAARSERKAYVRGVIHFLQVFLGMLCILGGAPASGGALVGTFLGLTAGIIGGAISNVIMVMAMPGIPAMYGSGTLLRWFCFSLPAGALGSVTGTVLSTAIGGIPGAVIGMLLGGLLASGGSFFLQRRIPDWKMEKRQGGSGALSK